MFNSSPNLLASLVNLDNITKQLYAGVFFQNSVEPLREVGGDRCTQVSGFSLGHTCHSVIGKTQCSFARVQLGMGAFDCSYMAAMSHKETVLTCNFFRALPSLPVHWLGPCQLYRNSEFPKPVGILIHFS